MTYLEILKPFLPENCIDPIAELLEKYPVTIKISKPRRSKHGDFRAAFKDKPNRITINANLNQYSFLLTLLHEIAHLIIFDTYGKRAKPHGKEWKEEYKKLISIYLYRGVFPPDVYMALKKTITKNSFTSSADIELLKIIRGHDEIKNRNKTVEQLEENTFFILLNGKKFKKGPQLRKRFKCECIDNKRFYLVHPMAEVIID